MCRNVRCADGTTMRTMRLLRRLGPLVVIGSVVGTTPASATDVSVQATLLNGSRSLTTATLGPLANVVRSQNVNATLSATRTIFSNTGQDTLTLYTGTYASTSTITLNAPANATAAVYNGYLVVTLVQ